MTAISQKEVLNPNFNSSSTETRKVTSELIDIFLLDPELINLPQNIKDGFKKFCIYYQADPFTDEAYLIAFKGKFNRMELGYRYFLKQGEKTGLIEYTNVWSDYKNNELYSFAEVKRVDQSQPISVEIKLSESVNPNTFWKKAPQKMLENKAIKRCYQIAFPDSEIRLNDVTDSMKLDLISNQNASINNVKCEKTKKIYQEAFNLIVKHSDLLQNQKSRFNNMIIANLSLEAVTLELEAIQNIIKDHDSEKEMYLNAIEEALQGNESVLYGKPIQSVIDTLSTKSLDVIKDQFEALKIKIKNYQDSLIETEEAQEEEAEEVATSEEVQEEETKELTESDIKTSIELYNTEYSFPSTTSEDFDISLMNNFLSRFESNYIRIKEKNIVIHDFRKLVPAFEEFGNTIFKSRGIKKNLKDDYIKRISSLISNWNLLDNSTHIQSMIQKAKEDIIQTNKLENDKIHMAKVQGQIDNVKAREKAYYKSMGC